MLAVLPMCFVIALLAPWIARRWSGRGVWLLLALPVGLAIHFAALAPRIASGAVPEAARAWAPAMGVELALRCDGLSLIFALLISILGALVVAYSIGYLEPGPRRDRFFGFLLLFMGAMLGIVLADDLFALYVFWELTTVASFVLIGFDSERAEARSAARQSLLVTSLCGLAMLAGFVLLSIAGGTSRISELLARGDAIREHHLYAPALALIALGAFAKSAQFPLHFWLPNAMSAPTPVSAYLHSATMVKAGVYLLARLAPALGGTALWRTLLVAVGAATMVLGAVLALRHTDLKRVLAYSTIAMLGMLTFLLGVGSEPAAGAAMVLLVAHALYKGALFLCAGAIDHRAGSRDVGHMGGLARPMPITAAAAALAAASMAGVPPLLGFAFKELTYAATLELGPLLTACAALASALTVTVAGVVAVRPFWGRAAPPPAGVREAPAAMWLPPALLAGAGALLGLFPGPLAALVLAPAAGAILGRSVELEVTALPHWSPELLLSVVTLALGVIGYLQWPRLRAWLARAEPLSALAPERVYDAAVAGLQRVAVAQTRVLQHGQLRYYLATMLATHLALAAGAMSIHDLPVALPAALPDAPTYEWLLMGLAFAAALAVTLTRSPIFALMALAVLGFAVALLFLVYGAIDLAMTQFLVETVMVLVLLQVLRRLPPRARGSQSAPARALWLALPLAFGAMITLALLVVLQQPFDGSVSEYYVRASEPVGHGRNVVNVILVDFRALDTLGEITVIATAALGIWAMLAARSASGPRRSP